MTTQVVTCDEWMTSNAVNGSLFVEWACYGEEWSGECVTADTLIFRACPPLVKDEVRV
jgi:hypothetical protein